MQIITNSRAASFKTCRRRHYYEYEHGLRRDIGTTALRMGSAGHLGLEVLFRTGDYEASVAAVREYYESIIGLGEHIEYERETVVALVCGYAWRWPTLEVVAVELPFEVPLPHDSVSVAAGKIDLIAKDGGQQFIYEHKFLGEDISDDARLWERLEMDPQTSLYLWAARQSGIEVDGIIYDVIRKPTIKPKERAVFDDDGLRVVLDADGKRVIKKDGKPRVTEDKKKGYTFLRKTPKPHEWADELLNDITERPDYYYCRKPIPKLASEIYECVSEFSQVGISMAEARRNASWYRTVSRDTCGFCPVKSLCFAKYNPCDSVPEGFVKLDDIHPELEAS